MEVRIPRTATDRREITHARLLRRTPQRYWFSRFDRSVYLKPGSLVDESELRPTPDFPKVPLVLEYAGRERGLGPNRRGKEIHVLWRYDPATHDWAEIARVLSEGPEWFYRLQPIIRRELMTHVQATCVAEARAVTDRVLELLDGELSVLEEEGRERAMCFLYDQLTARLGAESRNSAAA